jgi:hypothetical protein
LSGVVDTTVLIGMRRSEEERTRALLTTNVKHFPMFDGLVAPY